MTMLFVESKRAEQFDKRVRPVFESRGISIDDREPFSSICKCFSRDIQIWEVRLEVPEVGSVHRVDTRRKKPVFINDSQAHWDDRDWNEEGEVLLEVESVFGRNASCKRINGHSGSTHRSSSEMRFFAISSDSVTILAVPWVSLDCFVALDVWPHELVPLPIASQRLGEQVRVHSSTRDTRMTGAR